MRQDKSAIVKEIREAVDGKSYTFLASYQGLKVEQINSLRQKLAPMQGRLLVVKNSFFRVAVKDLGWGDISSWLTGSSACISGMGDASQVAKLLKNFRKEKENELLTVKGGRLGDRLISASDIEQIANLPAIEVMRAKLVGTIAAPMTQVVGVMQQKVSSLLYVLKAVEEKKAKG